MTDHENGQDERMRAALARLTANERECLRRRLLPQTAKEMAIDLGISPHAVEKRLKMARAKLGVSSSLAAARLLAAAEGYGAVVPSPSALPVGSAAGQGATAVHDGPLRWRVPPVLLVSGACLMIVAAALLALLPQARPAIPATPADGGRDDVVLILPETSPGPVIAGRPAPELAETMRTRRAGPAEVAAFGRSSFGTMDKDGSGFIERDEAPLAGVGVENVGSDHRPGGTRSWSIGPQGQARWVALMDRDGDGRVSEAEYVAHAMRVWRDQVPANWAWRR